MNPAELSRRLRRARELAGLSQQQVASAMGVPRTTVTQMEGGGRAVSTLELTRLARLYARPVTWLLAEGAEDGDLVAALHDAAPGIAEDPEIRGGVHRLVALCREGAALERFLGRSPPVLATYPLPEPANKGEAVSQGERVAEQERRRLDLGAAPIAKVADLVAEQGIWASAVDLPADMSGLFLCHRDVGLAVLVNAAHVPDGMCFSYARGYAHAVLDRERPIIVSDGETAHHFIEIRAKSFAAAFLMPADAVAQRIRILNKGEPSRIERSIFDPATGGVIEAGLRPPPRSQQISCHDVAGLARHFCVSYAATLYRLKSLRYLSQAECAVLKGQEKLGLDYLRLLGIDNPSPASDVASGGLRARVAQLAIEAYRRGEISRGKLFELSSNIDVLGEALLAVAEATPNQ
jgi:transcriptional regulator with XRE-family HTH domain